MYPDSFVPAFDLTIRMPGKGEVRDYARSVDFQTGEATVHWADDRGVFERRMFVSRKDGRGGAVDHRAGSRRRRAAGWPCNRATSSDQPNAEGSHKQSNEVFKSHVSDIVTHGRRHLAHLSQPLHQGLSGQHPRPRRHGPGGRHRRHRPTPRTTARSAIKDADQVLVIRRHPAALRSGEIADGGDESLARRTCRPTIGQLLAGHAEIHGALFNRMRLDLGGGADHQRTTEELLEKSSYENLNRGADREGVRRRPLQHHFLHRRAAADPAGRLGRHLCSRLGQRLHPQRQRPVRHRRQPDGQHARAHAGLHLLHRVDRPVAGDQRQAHLRRARRRAAVALDHQRLQQRPRRRTSPAASGSAARPGRPISSTITISTPATANSSPSTPCRSWKRRRCSSRTTSTRDPTENSSSRRPSRRKTPRATRKSQGTFNATMDVAAAKELLRNTASPPPANSARTRTRSRSGRRCSTRCRTT